MALLSEFDLKLAAQADAHQLFLETLYAALFQSNPEIFAAFESTIYAKLKALSLGARYGESSLMVEAINDSPAGDSSCVTEFVDRHLVVNLPTFYRP
jgi:hypothetical protein